MPIDKSVENPITSENLPGTVARTAAKLLINQTEERIKQLFSFQKNISERRSSLDILMKRYFIESSHLDTAAAWYGEKPWWGQSILMGGVIGLSTLIGAIFNVAVVIAITTFGIMAMLTFFLVNHHRISTTRNERLYADIQKREEANKVEVEQLREIELSLNRVLINLGLAQLRLLEDNAEFEKTIGVLRQEVNNLTATVQQLVEIKNDLLTSQQHLLQQFADARQHLLKTQETLKEKTVQLDTRNTEFMAMKTKLESGSQDLETIHNEYQKRLHQLTELETGFKEQLALFTTSVAKNTPTLEASQSLPSAAPILGNGHKLQAFKRFLVGDNDEAVNTALAKANALLEGRRNKQSEGAATLGTIHASPPLF